MVLPGTVVVKRIQAQNKTTVMLLSISSVFSRASAKAERNLSSLYSVFLYVEWGDPGVYTP